MSAPTISAPSPASAEGADQILTTAEAAAYLRLPKGTLEVWRQRGQGPRYSKIGRCVRYRQSQLDEFMVENEQGGSR